MDEKLFIRDYLNRYNKSLFKTDVSDKIIKMKKILLEAKNDGRKVMIAGNGGSAAMASHVAVDFTKQGKIRTINFNEPDLITCFANDYGYENWISKAIEFYGDKNDVVILISSSGNSKNKVNAALAAKSLGMNIEGFQVFHQKIN
jgi:Phosphoheptose isomerase